MVDGHILYLWNMDYKFPELSNYSCPGQETTPLRDVKIRIFAQMPKISRKVCGRVNQLLGSFCELLSTLHFYCLQWTGENLKQIKLKNSEYMWSLSKWGLDVLNCWPLWICYELIYLDACGGILTHLLVQNFLQYFFI